jgi:hypothetical protein
MDRPNLGVILGQRAEDYIAGGSPIQHEVRVPTGDWTPYLPSGEKQFSQFADSMACVSFSALNCIETQIRFLTNIEPNYSDRALAKMSNTQTNGNYLWRVADTIRQEGLIEESIWPAPQNFTWDDYYAQIPVQIENTAGVFLTKYDVLYEWLPDASKETLMHHLKQSPIQVVIPGHAIMCFYSTDQVSKYFDTYEPFVKNYTPQFVAAMKYVVTLKSQKMTRDEVIKQYVLAFYREPDATELAYWTGKPLADFLNAAISDRAAFLTAHK